MTSQDYRRALKIAQIQLQKRVDERDKLNLQIIELQNTIRGLALRCAEEERREIMQDASRLALSLSETVKTILRQNGKPMTAAEVRDALWASGFDMGQYANALPLVQATLERLVQGGFATRLPGKPATYQWPQPTFYGR